MTNLPTATPAKKQPTAMSRVKSQRLKVMADIPHGPKTALFSASPVPLSVSQDVGVSSSARDVGAS